MTVRKSFKRLVRTRMEKTGESYAAARASLLAAHEPKTSAEPVLATSDDAIRERTGRGWEQWFDLLDEWGAAERPHREIARWVAGQLAIEPLAWSAQAVTVSYERARGLRAVGERTDGFTVTASKTVAVSVERLYQAFVDESVRERWLPGGKLRERTAASPKSARFDWGDGPTRVHVTFLAKGDAKSTATLEHVRLVDAEQAERMKASWRERLTALKSQLEGGETDA
jgi:uncharacterized protein YndB with AHSA1/START domain